MQIVSDQAAEHIRLLGELESMIHLCTSYRETILPNLEAMVELSTAEWIAGRTGTDELLENLEELEEAVLEEKRIYAAVVFTYAKLLELRGTETGRGEFL